MSPVQIIGEDMFAADNQHVAEVVPSANINERRNGLGPEILVMHYTGLPTFQRSIDVLRDPRCEVSCHYVVDVDGRIVQMVEESMRAWHAGASSWHGERDINSQSIGIEIQNTGHTHRTGQNQKPGARQKPEHAPDFPDEQMRAVEQLAADIIARHGIKPRNVVAHSDIAPGRKIDPGEKFDWQRLWSMGIGHWVPPEPLTPQDVGHGPGVQNDTIADTQAMLRAYGYGIEPTGVLDELTATVVAAFQRHFRPTRVDGRIDRSTRLTLMRLGETVDTNHGQGRG